MKSSLFGGQTRSRQDILVLILTFSSVCSVAYLLRTALNGKPFLLILPFAFVVSLSGCVMTRMRWLRKVYLLFAATALMATVVEAGFLAVNLLEEPNECRKERSGKWGPYFNNDSDLGYEPIPHATVGFRHYCGDQVNYDVVYRVDEFGQRETPGNPEGETVLFLGGSFTFGEGVEDHETLPAVFSRVTDHQYNVVNFGASGWGPHQMLRIIETDRPTRRIGGPVRHVFYSMIRHHIVRSAGRAEWDPYGPCYELNSRGDIEYRGPFRDRFAKAVFKLLHRSWLGDALVRAYLSQSPGDRDRQRFAKIVARSAELVREKYDAPFTVIIWGSESEENQKEFMELIEYLKQEWSPYDIRIVVLSESPVGREINSERISEDRHPNPRAYELLADLLAKLIKDDSKSSVDIP